MDSAADKENSVFECRSAPLEDLPVSIFVKTCSKDYAWLRYCLLSIRKFCSGFRSVVIVCDDIDRNISGWIGDMMAGCVYSLHYAETRSSCTGYLQQQAVKLCALQYCPPETQIVLFLDSDSIFTCPVTPQCFLAAGAPILTKASYEDLSQSETERPAVRWKAITEAALGRPVNFEYMRQMPIVVHRETLLECQSQYPHWYEAIMSGGMAEFSEFNAIGCVAEASHPWLYQIRDVGGNYSGSKFCVQYWSWGGLTESIQAEIEATLQMR